MSNVADKEVLEATLAPAVRYNAELKYLRNIEDASHEERGHKLIVIAVFIVAVIVAVVGFSMVVKTANMSQQFIDNSIEQAEEPSNITGSY